MATDTTVRPLVGLRNSPRRAPPPDVPTTRQRGAVAANNDAQLSSLPISNHGGASGALEAPEPAVVADGTPAPARPSLEVLRHRHSSSSWSNFTISRIKTGLTSEQAQKKFVMLKNVLAFIGLCTGIAAAYGLYTGYKQTWYAKASYDQGIQAQQQGNQAQQQAMEWTAWQMKSQFYNDCLNVKASVVPTSSWRLSAIPA